MHDLTDEECQIIDPTFKDWADGKEYKDCEKARWLFTLYVILNPEDDENLKWPKSRIAQKVNGADVTDEPYAICFHRKFVDGKQYADIVRKCIPFEKFNFPTQPMKSWKEIYNSCETSDKLLWYFSITHPRNISLYNLARLNIISSCDKTQS